MMLVPDLLREQASRDPKRTAVLVDGVGAMTYAEWEASSNRLARSLANAGLRPGERAALLLSNQNALTYLIAYFAIHKAGGVAVPVNTRLSLPEMQRLVRHCEPSALLFGDSFVQTADALREDLTGARIAWPSEEIQLRSRSGDASAFQVARNDDDLADILYTSGTTGVPKGVACSHSNVTYQGNATMHNVFRGAVFLHAVPLFTFAGTHAMTLIPLRGGMTNVIQPVFDPARFLDLIREHQVNVAYAVPSMVLLLLANPNLSKGSYPSLRLFMYGAAPMPPKAIRELSEAFPETLLLNLYGLTEGGGAVCVLPPGEAQMRPASIGKPVPPAEVRVVDDQGRDLPARSEGEIMLRAPVKPRMYYKDAEATAQTWLPGGWLRTGDIGYLDEDGYVYLVDRKKDLIIRGGFNISAPEVEGVILEHPEVAEVAVIGVPHPVLGEDLMAFVVRKPNSQIAGSQIEGFCRKRLADYKVPRTYSFLDALPRNALGKVLKRELREKVTSCS